MKFDSAMLIELFGYLGSAMVVVSMLMSSLVKLRIVNTVGSIISGIYALIIGSFPLALMNGCLIVINVYNLSKLLVNKQQYDLVKFAGQDTFVHYFIDHYKEDILIYFPEFQTIDPQMDTVYMVFCNGDPAGILLGKTVEQGIVAASLEYATPAYRDCSIGKFLYSALPGENVNTLMMENVSEKHRPYMEKMGFVNQDGCYMKKL